MKRKKLSQLIETISVLGREIMTWLLDQVWNFLIGALRKLQPRQMEKDVFTPRHLNYYNNFKLDLSHGHVLCIVLGRVHLQQWILSTVVLF